MTEEQNRNIYPWEWKWNFFDRERDPVKYWLCRIVVWIINIGLGIGLLVFFIRFGKIGGGVAMG